ncbi:hypothetical protein GPECTOR_50g626 [Gonium pectorale]|uniref:Ion transport domain-containing protein n=1 Tax=Gonium pectorale TaxID=33097 RepID=A0A150G7K9_GONPE|nr:hypothetical protein GPECTOR_50g626 [Gonium pectorale]|eukprot:KXZ45832.1 hypothetical protein GPECTOR_50g626 [Gonium pectorale]
MKPDVEPSIDPLPALRAGLGRGPAPAHLVPELFTLLDLNRRSYFVIHHSRDGPHRALPEPLHPFRLHLRRAVVLANLQVCFARNAQLAGKPLSCVALDPRAPLCPPEEGPAHQDALQPINDLLPPGSLYTVRDVTGLLDEELGKAAEALKSAADSVTLHDAEPLQELADTFAAYQPSALDEDAKGSMSPCDARSKTRSIADVWDLVAKSRTDAGTSAPSDLAALGMQLLGTFPNKRLAYKLSGWLLQAACMSGHCELVDQLLTNPQLVEYDIIRRLRAAWVGYKQYKPLQTWRSEHDPHLSDWLDFKCSSARAVVIAHKVVETLVLRDDHDAMGMSLHRSAGDGVRAASPPRDIAASGGGAEVSVAVDASGNRLPPSSPLPHGDCGYIGFSGNAFADSPYASAVRPFDGQHTKRVTALPNMMSNNMSRELLTDDQHAELEPRKWRLVMDLFKRPAACKPLALAMMHVVLYGKKQVQAALHKDRMHAEGEAEDEAAAAAAPLTRGGLATEEDPDPDSLAAEAARAAAREEEARMFVRYRKLHLLAVQACHLAVHSTSLGAVSDAIVCIRAVRAWPAIDLHFLNDLAQLFPRQAAQLLEAIPLVDVDLEDNVLPFGLPSGFTTVVVSDQDAKDFRETGDTGSTQDAEHFATQREADASIESSLLVLGRTWLALFLLFWPTEFRTPTASKLLRVLGCAVAAFMCQGPGSIAVALVFGLILLVVGVASRATVAVVRIVYWSVLRRLWYHTVKHFPALSKAWNRIRGAPMTTTTTALLTAASGRVAPGTPLSPNLIADRERGAPFGRGPDRDRGAMGEGEGGEVGDGGEESDSDDEGELERITALLGRGIWRSVVAHGHNAVIDAAVGWNKGSASISCRKVPMPLRYGQQDPLAAGQQRDSALLEKLLHAPNVHPSVFGTRVLRAMILFKWNYFTKYFIILQLLLHATYMAVFTAYAFTIKDMMPVDGREKGPGAHTAGCQLQAPTRVQTGLLTALAVMTVDFAVQEIRQIRHFGLRFFMHTWDLLDVASVALVVASIVLHFSCTSGVSPLTLRGLAAVQIVLLFMRLLYYAMASDKLGSFVRMVLETTYDLLMFFAFLSVVFVGFALAIIVAQGALADEEQTFIKMFTMMYGDFDVSYLSSLDSGALGLDAITRVIASVYMILVTIILLNLLISIISESYERIRENERWESLRNKALLVVESETQLSRSFLAWLYATLTPPSKSDKDSGKRYLYVIAPEYARRAAPADEEEEEEEDDDEDGVEDDDDDAGADGQWNGRLGEMKRHITIQSRGTMDMVRKVLDIVKEMRHPGAAAAAPTAEPSFSATSFHRARAACGPGPDPNHSWRDNVEAVTAVESMEPPEVLDGAVEPPASAAAMGAAAVAAAAERPDGHAAYLDPAVERIAKALGESVKSAMQELRMELREEIAKAVASPQSASMAGRGPSNKQFPSAAFPRLAPLTVAPSSPPLRSGVGVAVPLPSALGTASHIAASSTDPGPPSVSGRTPSGAVHNCVPAPVHMEKTMSRGNKRDIDRARAQKRNEKGVKQSDKDGLTPDQRRERDAKALAEKVAKKATTQGQ